MARRRTFAIVENVGKVRERAHKLEACGYGASKPRKFIMLKHTLLHPEITAILARAGHHSKVLIADGNYPASNTLGPNAQLVSLNLSPGVVSCTQVLSALLAALPIEAANTMGIPADEIKQLLLDVADDSAVKRWNPVSNG